MKRLFAILSVIVCSSNVYGATNNLTDCSQTTVQNAINSSSTGDVLVCPAGSWSWSNVNITKNIILRGAGIGNTLITITASGGIKAPASYSGAFRLTGFTFIASANFGNYWDAMLFVYASKGFRIYNNEFQIYSTDASPGTGGGGNAMHLLYTAAGLIDSNRFVQVPGQTTCMHAAIQISNSGTNLSSDQAQEYSWLNFDSNTVLGSAANTIFVDNNYFYNRNNCWNHNSHAIYVRRGGVVALRHNEIHGFNADVHPFYGINMGGFAAEISNNTWINDTGYTVASLIDIDGGTGVIYGNSNTGTPSSIGIQLLLKRVQTAVSGSGVTSYVPGYGTANGAINCQNAEGYPCAQQVGRGRNNSSDPWYFWNNTTFPPLRNPVGTTYIQSGRDYYLNAGPKPGYTSYTYPHPLTGGEQPPPPPPPPPDLIPMPPSIIGVN